jgi:hypothetical protein
MRAVSLSKSEAGPFEQCDSSSACLLLFGRAAIDARMRSASRWINADHGSLADGMFANLDFRQAFDQFVPARSPYARPAADIREELQNVGDMQ